MKIERLPGKVGKIRIEDDGSYFNVSEVNGLNPFLFRMLFYHIIDVVCGKGTKCEISLGLTCVR